MATCTPHFPHWEPHPGCLVPTGSTMGGPGVGRAWTPRQLGVRDLPMWQHSLESGCQRCRQFLGDQGLGTVWWQEEGEGKMEPLAAAPVSSDATAQ